MEEFKNGNFTKAKDNDAVTREAIQRMKAQGRDPQHAFNYDKWKKEFHQNLDRLSQSQTGFIQRRNTAQMQAQQYGQFTNSLGQFGSQLAQGIGTSKQAKHNAAATLEGTASQMAGSASTDCGRGMETAYNAQKEAVGVLERIHQTNSSTS